MTCPAVVLFLLRPSACFNKLLLTLLLSIQIACNAFRPSFASGAADAFKAWPRMGAQFGGLAFASVGVLQLLKLLGGCFQPEAESELLALAPWVEVVTT